VCDAQPKRVPVTSIGRSFNQSINQSINQAYDMADIKPVWVIAATMQLPAKHGMQS
jgi:hypothetical protein